MYNPITASEASDIATYKNAIDFLYNRLQSNRKQLLSKTGNLSRTSYWMRLSDNPQEKLKTIHIAGTSGKGSTSYILSSILLAAGKTTGTFLSPHVYDIRERMLLNLKYISKEDFKNRVKNIIPLIAKMEVASYDRPIYFEVMYALAMQLFAEEKVNYGVVETGIGGRYDPTNCVKRQDKLAVITRLGLDHTEILGNTMAEIAWQKGGIIPRNGASIAIKPNEREAEDVLIKIANEQNSSLTMINPKTKISNISQTVAGLVFDYDSQLLGKIKNINLPLIGNYQAENAILAIEAAAILAKRDGWILTKQHILDGLNSVSIPARSEIRTIANHPVIIDGAHNPQKIKAFFESVKSLKLPMKPLVIFGSKHNKDYESSIDIIGESAEKVFVCNFFTDKINPFLAEFAGDSKQITDKFLTKGYKANGGYKSPLDAFESALEQAKPNQPIIITGSIYMIGELNEQLKVAGLH